MPSLKPSFVLVTLCLSACARTDISERALGAHAAALSASRLHPLVDDRAVDRLERHLLITLKLPAEGASVLDAREVDFPLPRERAPEPQSWRVLVEGGSGQILYLAQLATPEPLRAELAGPDGTIEAAPPTLSASPVLAVRLPVLRGAATLRLFGPAASLPPGDPRTRASPPERLVEMGAVPFPAVTR